MTLNLFSLHPDYCHWSFTNLKLYVTRRKEGRRDVSVREVNAGLKHKHLPVLCLPVSGKMNQLKQHLCHVVTLTSQLT